MIKVLVGPQQQKKKKKIEKILHFRVGGGHQA